MVMGNGIKVVGVDGCEPNSQDSLSRQAYQPSPLAHMNRNRLTLLRPATLLLVPALAFFLAACDTADPAPQNDVVIQGMVTSTGGHAEQPTEGHAVRGATVTAVSIGADGQVQTLPGEVTTDAEGRYTITTTATADPIRLTAETADGFRGATLIEGQAGLATGTVTAAPMNLQSTAGADAFVSARQQYPHVSAADAMLMVSDRTSQAIHDGHATVDAVGHSMAAAVEAETRFAMHADGAAATEAQIDDMRADRRAAYGTFRTQIGAATTADDRHLAIEAFQDAYAESFTGAGLTRTHAAHATAAGAGAGARFSTAGPQGEFGVTYPGRVASGLTMSAAIEDEFQAAGASATTMSGLADARTAFSTSLRGATTQQQMDDAYTTYRQAVRNAIVAETNLPGATVDAAFDATASARTALDTSVAGATDATGIANAYAAYYPAATAAAETALGAEAGFAASSISMLGVH